MSFFDDKSDKEDDESFSDWEKRMRDRMRKMKDDHDSEDLLNIRDSMIESIKNFTPSSDDFDKIKQLGKPDYEEFFEEDGVEFIKKTWNIEGGQYVMVEVLSETGEIDYETALDKVKGNKFKNHHSLPDQLELALEQEDYERAAQLRDIMAQKKIDDDLFTDKGDVNIG